MLSSEFRFFFCSFKITVQDFPELSFVAFYYTFYYAELSFCDFLLCISSFPSLADNLAKDMPKKWHIFEGEGGVPDQLVFENVEVLLGWFMRTSQFKSCFTPTQFLYTDRWEGNNSVTCFTHDGKRCSHTIENRNWILNNVIPNPHDLTRPNKKIKNFCEKQVWSFSKNRNS